MRADSAACTSARHSHRGLAREYAMLIERTQHDLGAGAMLLAIE